MSGSVLQAGAVVAGRPAVWLANGTLADGGPAGIGALAQVGITNSGGLALGINSGPVTGPVVSWGVYVSPDGVVTLAATSTNGAPAASLQFVINDVIYPVGNGLGDVLGPDSSVSGNAVVFNGTTGTVIADAGAPPVLATNAALGAALLTFLESLPTAPQATPGWWNNSGQITYT